MATDTEKLAEAITRLADVHEEGFIKVSNSIVTLAESIGVLSDVDNGLMVNDYSLLTKGRGQIAEAIQELAKAIGPKPK